MTARADDPCHGRARSQPGGGVSHRPIPWAAGGRIGRCRAAPRRQSHYALATGGALTRCRGAGTAGRGRGTCRGSPSGRRGPAGQLGGRRQTAALSRDRSRAARRAARAGRVARALGRRLIGAETGHMIRRRAMTPQAVLLRLYDRRPEGNQAAHRRTAAHALLPPDVAAGEQSRWIRGASVRPSAGYGGLCASQGNPVAATEQEGSNRTQEVPAPSVRMRHAFATVRFLMSRCGRLTLLDPIDMVPASCQHTRYTVGGPEAMYRWRIAAVMVTEHHDCDDTPTR